MHPEIILIADESLYTLINWSYSFNNIFGDAIWELSKVTESREDGNPKTIRGWFNQYLEAGEDNSQEAFFPRGGYWTNTAKRACAVWVTLVAMPVAGMASTRA